MNKLTHEIPQFYGDKVLQSLSAGHIGAWYWELDSNKIYIDSTLADFFSLSQDDAQAGQSIETFIERIYEADKAHVKKNIDKSLETLEDYQDEYRIIDTSGKERWVIARGKVAKDNDGKPVGFPGVMIDITDRKNAELKQAETEKRFNFMADAMPQLVWIADGDGAIEYYNQRWHDFTGTKPGEADGSDEWSQLLHPEDQEHALKAWHKAIKTGQPYEVQYRLRYASNRTYRWVMGRAMPFINDQGEIVKWYGTCTDIDEQKHASIVQTFLAKASKSLASSINYSKTLKSVADLSVTHVADWCSVELFNDGGSLEQVAVAHSDPEKVSQATDYRQMYPVNLESKAGIGKAIRTKKTEIYPYIDADMIKASTRSKSEREFLLSLNLRSMIIAPIIDRNEPVGVIIFVLSDTARYFNSDDVKMAEKIASRIALAIGNAKLYESSLLEIQARKKLEKELIIEQQKLESRVKERTRQLDETNKGLVEEVRLRQSAEDELKAYSEELSRSNQELQDFAYVASHDLQEPLRKIQAFGDILRSEYADRLGDGVDYLNRMLNAASRMSSLIHDLLSFSRVSNSTKPYVKVDLNTVVAEVIIDLESAIDGVDGEVVVGKLPSVYADPTHMRQLFQNLISNGLKFHRPEVNPIVEILPGRRSRDEIEILVKDNGIGFDEKYQEKIFSVFQRLHGRDSYEGTGIGLAVCRKIAQRYGGTISAEGIPGQGATFIIRLPKNYKEDVNDD